MADYQVRTVITCSEELKETLLSLVIANKSNFDALWKIVGCIFMLYIVYLLTFKAAVRNQEKGEHW